MFFNMMLILMYIHCCMGIAKNKIPEHQTAMKVFFLHDVRSSAHIFLCMYCEETKDKNPKCQTSMRVMRFWVMLVLLYVL
jgi:hypothetical protein